MNELHAAKLAAMFAQKIGLPAGNMWEPGIARNIAKRYAQVGDWAVVRTEYEAVLGIQS